MSLIMARILSRITYRVNVDGTEEDEGQLDEGMTAPSNSDPPHPLSNHHGAISQGDSGHIAHTRRPLSHESNDRHAMASHTSIIILIPIFLQIYTRNVVSRSEGCLQSYLRWCHVFVLIAACKNCDTFGL